MQKLFRFTDKYTANEKEVLKEYLSDGWKVINITTTSTSQGSISYFHTLVLIEK